MERGSVIDAKIELQEQQLKLDQKLKSALGFLLEANRVFYEDSAKGILSGTPTCIKYKHLPIV